MIQLADIHLDLKYNENSTVYCDDPLCCRTPASYYSRIKSGKQGYHAHCDGSLNTLDSFMDKAYELQPDFIIWTGDNSSIIAMTRHEIGIDLRKDFPIKVSQLT